MAEADDAVTQYTMRDPRTQYPGPPFNTPMQPEPGPAANMRPQPKLRPRMSFSPRRSQVTSLPRCSG